MNKDRIKAMVHDPVLKKTLLFEYLSELELNAVLAFMEPRRIKGGETVFKEGAAGEEMFILVSGGIQAWLGQADGTRRMMFEIKPRDFFGEMSIIANESRSATLITTMDTELLALHVIDFYRIVFEHPMIGMKILQAIGKVQNSWLEQTSKHLGDLMRWGETARRRAIIDELTGIYNRRFLEESANKRLDQVSNMTRSLSLVMMDLDKIHEVNTKHGTKGGDMVLTFAAEVIRSVTRVGDICARLAGDEFAILLPDTDHEEARSIAEEICQAMLSIKVSVPDRPEGTGRTRIIVSSSLGVASAPLHAKRWSDLSLAADKALSRAKEMGRNRVEVAR
ncbi:MAG: GGDEF domain-containing protein [Treponema sp.]|nr:GGDEF domain-containing protein [Treponema sp.]